MVFTHPFYTYESLSLDRSLAILVLLVPMPFLVPLHLHDDLLVPWPRWHQQHRWQRNQSGCHCRHQAISDWGLGSSHGFDVVQPLVLSMATVMATYCSVALQPVHCNEDLPNTLASATWDRC
jgi:hypothetical protein